MKTQSKIQLEKLIESKLKELHESDLTLKILYGAIENCSSEDVHFHRDNTLDSFNDNDYLLAEKDGIFYYMRTQCVYEGDTNETEFDKLVNSIITSMDELGLDEKEVSEWIEIEYKKYVFFFFSLCLELISPLNNTITEY